MIASGGHGSMQAQTGALSVLAVSTVMFAACRPAVDVPSYASFVTLSGSMGSRLHVGAILEDDTQDRFGPRRVHAAIFVFEREVGHWMHSLTCNTDGDVHLTWKGEKLSLRVATDGELRGSTRIAGAASYSNDGCLFLFIDADEALRLSKEEEHELWTRLRAEMAARVPIATQGEEILIAAEARLDDE